MIVYLCIAWILFGVFNWLVTFPIVYKYAKVDYKDNEVFLGFCFPPIIFIVGLCFLLIHGISFDFVKFSKKLWKL